METAIVELLDAAKKVCKTDAALAGRLGVVPQAVSRWRRGHDPMTEDRVVQIARIAHENEGFWLARIAAEQSLGDTRRAWERVAAALPRVAMVALVLGGVFAHHPAAAQNMNDGQSKHYAKLREICAKFTGLLRWFRHGFSPTALLA